jgi:long-chain acyl-CoA synthetase
MKIGDLLTQAAERVPRKSMVIYKSKKYSFRESEAIVNRFGNGLLSIGVETGKKVAILLDNRPDYLFAYFACHRIGAPVVPINNFLKGNEIKYILEDCGVHTLITSPRYYTAEIKGIENKLTTVRNILFIAEDEEIDGLELADTEKNYIRYSSFRQLGSDNPKPIMEFGPEDLAVIIYTSGTTGHPKGAMLSHSNIVTNSTSCTKVLKINRKDKILLFLPMFHSFTELVCMVLPVQFGVPIVLVDRIDRVEIRAAIKRHRPTLLIGVPSVYNALLGAKLNPITRLLNPVRLYVSGGAPLPVEILTSFEAKFRRPLVEGYGLSEASPVVSVNPIDGLRKPGSVGLPVEHVEVKVVDDHGAEVPRGYDGELLVRGPNVMSGYYNLPDETAETIKDGWLYTGDIAHIDEEGYIFIVERKKDMLIYRGCNIYPREVEEILYKHPAIKDVAVVGVPDAARGEMPKAFVVLKEGHHATEKDLKKFCMDHLARYKVPRIFSFETDLPRTPTGKVLKKELRKRVLQEQVEDVGDDQI